MKMLWLVRALALISSFLGGSQIASAQEALVNGRIDKGVSNYEIKGLSVTDGSPQADRLFEYVKAGATFISLSIKEIHLSDGDKVEFRNAGRTGEDLTISGPRSEVPFDLQSLFIRGDRIQIRLRTSIGSKSKLKIGRIAYQDPSISPWKSIFGENHLKNINDPLVDPVVQENKRSIVFLAFVRDEEPKSCSGFLIGLNLVMTNYHCVNDSASCSSANVVFDFERSVSGYISMGAVARCVDVVATDSQLDYALIRLDRVADASIRPFSLSVVDGPVGEAASMVQHPGGNYKQVASFGCQIISSGVPGSAPDGSKTDFTHRCDTMNGSSGSPITRSNIGKEGVYCVIGLHHWGFVPGGDFESYNRAVRSSLIAASLSEKGLEFTKCGL